MSGPILTAGTFEPGTTVNGRVVASWGAWNTVPRYCGGDTYYHVVIRFVDGTSLFATSLSRKAR
jgi:hypothetical protein